MLIVRHFHLHLEAISDQRVLDLVYLAQTKPITNSDVQSALHMKRGGAWVWLDRLTEPGLLEKIGAGYIASDYSRELISSVSQVFRGAVKGEFPEPAPSIPREIITIAREGVEAQYERGRLSQEEYNRRLRLIDGAEAALK
jgi:hypothetical protein